MTSRLGSGTVAASRRMTASPPFMSQVPRPCSRSPVAAGRQVVVDRHRVEVAGDHDPLAAAEVGAGDDGVAVPAHREVAERRSAASTASAIACSFRLTDSMSTSCTVRSTASAVRSRSGTRQSIRRASAGALDVGRELGERHPGAGLVVLGRYDVRAAPRAAARPRCRPSTSRSVQVIVIAPCSSGSSVSNSIRSTTRSSGTSSVNSPGVGVGGALGLSGPVLGPVGQRHPEPAALHRLPLAPPGGHVVGHPPGLRSLAGRAGRRRRRSVAPGPAGWRSGSTCRHSVAELELVLVLPYASAMRNGLVLFSSDRGITPAGAGQGGRGAGLRHVLRARAHPHPGQADRRAPGHRRRDAARRPLHAAPSTRGSRWPPPPRSPRGSGCRPRSRCRSSPTRSRWPRRSPPSTTSPAAGSRSAPASAGTPTSSRTTTSPRASAAPCSGSTSRRCARCGPRRRRRTTASSCRSARPGPTPSRSRPHIPLIIGAGGGPKTFQWIARARRRLDDHARPRPTSAARSRRSRPPGPTRAATASPTSGCSSPSAPTPTT